MEGEKIMMQRKVMEAKTRLRNQENDLRIGKHNGHAKRGM